MGLFHNVSWSEHRHYLYKFDSGGVPILLVECICSALLDECKFNGKPIPHVLYKILPYRVHGKHSIVCRNFCEEHEREIPIGFLLETYFMGLRESVGNFATLEDTLSTLSRLIGKGSKRETWVRHQFLSMLLFDYLVINRDRHWCNVSLIVNMKNGDCRLAPIYDNGLAFNYWSFPISGDITYLPFGVGQIEQLISYCKDDIFEVKYSRFRESFPWDVFYALYPQHKEKVPYCIDDIIKGRELPNVFKII